LRPEHSREWRESLGAYALGQLAPEERARVEAHLEGCAACRSELASLRATAALLPHADPDRLGPPPLPPAGLGERIAVGVAAEGRARRRRRLRSVLATSGVAAAVVVAVLAIFAWPGGEPGSPARHVSFDSLPPGIEIGATLEPRSFGTEVHVYVDGAPSGTLCRVFLRSEDGTRLSAGSFRYRWGEGSQAILSSALDLSRTAAVGVRVGRRTFFARL
jgi:hypothetical protein